MLLEYEKDIVSELKILNVHTVILYGSRARGDYNSHSDVDVIGFIDKGESFRIARFDKKISYFLIFLLKISKSSMIHILSFWVEKF